jgi:hypothetical protein
MSIGIVDIKVTCVMWDYLMIKPNRNKDDLFTFLAYVTGFLKQDLLCCTNVLEYERVLRSKAPMIDDYDFYTALFNAHRAKGHDENSFFEFPPAEKIHNLFPPLESVVQDRLRERSAANAMNDDQRAQE